MNETRVGKLSPEKMASLCAGSLGMPDKNLIVGPGAGLDAAILDLGDGRIMAVAEDPIFPAVGLPLETFGWFTVHIGASDVAVTGVKPSHMTYSLLLPPGFPEEDTRTIIESVSDTARELGITIAGGHTGWYGAVTVPTVGGITVWGFADSGKWVSPGGAKNGDLLLMTKGPAIEATALLAVLREKRLADALGRNLLERAIRRTSEITVVDDALTAFAAGGVHAMHDATEGGVLCGLWEISHAANVSVAANLDAVPIPEDIAAVAKELRFDPWAAISEGTLLAAVNPAQADAVRRALLEKHIPSWIIGRFDSSLPESTLKRNGTVSALPEPGPDPFWELFSAE